MNAEVRAFREILPKQPVGVLVRTTLPRAPRITEVDIHSRLHTQLGILGHFGTLIPSQRPSELLGKISDGQGNRIPHSLGPVACEGTSVLWGGFLPTVRHWGEVEKKGEARRSFHKRPNRRLPESDDEVAFPMAWDGPILHLGGSLTYPNVRGDEGLPTSASTLPWDAQSATRPQAGGQLTSKCPPALDV